MKKLRLLLIFLVMGIALTACLNKKETKQKVTKGEEVVAHSQHVLSAGHELYVEHPYEKAFEELALSVAQRTEGRVSIDTYPKGRLGTEEELLDLLLAGEADIAIVRAPILAKLVPELHVLDVPFLFYDRASAEKVFASSIGAQLFDKIRDEGLIPLAWVDEGFLHMTSERWPILHPRDMRKMTFRTEEHLSREQAFAELGAHPVMKSLPETLRALQQGNLEAQENTLLLIDRHKMYHYTHKYLSLTHHAYNIAFVLMSEKTYEQLSADHRNILLEEGKKIGAFARTYMAELEDELLKTVAKQGMEVMEPINQAPFRELVQRYYARHPYREIIQEIQRVQTESQATQDAPAQE